MRLSASLVGSCVPEQFLGHVHGSFRHGINVLLADESAPLVTLHDSWLPASPSSVRLAGVALAGFAAPVGSLVRCENGVVRVPAALGRGCLEIVLDGARRYDGTVSGREAQPDEVLAYLMSLGHAVCGCTDPDPGSLSAVARDRVRSTVRRLGQALAQDDSAATAKLAGALIGLGPGLTPSGDDALIGMLAARRCLGERNRADSALERLCRDALRLTSLVSASYLALAADGHFAQPLRDTARAIANRDDSALRYAAWHCARTGATSGADGLEGMMAGLAGYVSSPVAAAPTAACSPAS